MKRTWIVGLVTGMGLVACSTWAADAEAGKGLTAEQQRERNALIQKYDANKDGVLDKDEAKQMSKADKKALAKVGGIGTTKKDVKPEKPTKPEKPKMEPKPEKPAKTTEKSADDTVKAAKGKPRK